MIYESEFPILQFDENPVAKLMPSSFIKEKTLPECCIITFFKEVVEKMAKEANLKVLGYLHSEVLNIPIYEIVSEGKRMCLTMPFMTAPGAAATIEELHAMGCENFMVCGGAGSLQSELAVGHLIIPESAVRDEGTSYHYLSPSKEVACNEEALKVIEHMLDTLELPYVKGKTWTTDAIYRETKDKIEKRKAEGCITVEMEAAAFFAVSRFLKVKLGQLLYAGDDVAAEVWDSRGWNKRTSIRENLVDLSIKIATRF